MLSSDTASGAAQPAAGPLRICMVSDDFLPAATGVGVHLQALCRQLAALGHHVSVITVRRPGQPKEESYHGVHVIREPTVRICGYYQAMPSPWRLRRLFAAIRPDIVHFHYLGQMFLFALGLALKRGDTRVYTFHMTEDHLTQPLLMRPLRGLIARGIRRSCNRMHRVISVSANLAQAIGARGIIVPVTVIGNPVTLASAPAAPKPPGFTVLFAGRLAREKNIPLLLRAFALLPAHEPATLWLAGEGTERASLEKLVRRLGLSDRVIFLGFLGHEKLAGYYAACDVFVLPSLVETQGIVALEAMRFGRPLIVARSVVSAGELVTEGENGFLVDAQDERELADRLLLLAGDNDLRSRLGQASRKRAESFGIEAIAEATLRAYRDAQASNSGA